MEPYYLRITLRVPVSGEFYKEMEKIIDNESLSTLEWRKQTLAKIATLDNLPVNINDIEDWEL